MRLLTYDELCQYVLNTNRLGRYYGYYDGGFLDGRTCSILFETKYSSICNNYISPHMKFYVK